MKRVTSKRPDDIHLFLKRDMNARGIDCKTMSRDTGISYDRLVRTLRNEREFTAKEIGTIAQYMGISDIKKYFLGGNN